MMMPVGRLVLLRSVERRNMVSAMSWLLVPALIGPILGPPVGGFIVTYLDWRWIFYINVPIGILGVVLVTLFIEDVRGDNADALRCSRHAAVRALRSAACSSASS